MESLCISTNKMRSLTHALFPYLRNGTEINFFPFGRQLQEIDENRIVIERNLTEIIARRYYSRVIVSLVEIIRRCVNEYKHMGIQIKTPYFREKVQKNVPYFEIRIIRADFSSNQAFYEFLPPEMVKLAEKLKNRCKPKQFATLDIFYCNEHEKMK